MCGRGTEFCGPLGSLARDVDGARPVWIPVCPNRCQPVPEDCVEGPKLFRAANWERVFGGMPWKLCCGAEPTFARVPEFWSALGALPREIAEACPLWGLLKPGSPALARPPG